MAPDAPGIEAKVRDLTEAIVAREGYELVDVEYRLEPGSWTLKLFIDKQGGVNLDDCQRVSHVVSTVLDVEDPIPHRYSLQVSSPGLDRSLKRDTDFIAAEGKMVRLVTREPISGQRKFSGRLIQVGPGENGATLVLHLQDDSGSEHAVPVDALNRANIVYEWPDEPARNQDRKKSRK